jgi:hypothetical protein
MGMAIANPAQTVHHKTSSGREDGGEEGGSKESDIGRLESGREGR